MSLEDFMNACEHQLKRVEDVLDQPLKLQSELTDLEELLRNEWPNAILSAKDDDLVIKQKEKIEIILDRIKKLEIKTKTKVSLFDGMKEFIQQATNR